MWLTKIRSQNEDLDSLVMWSGIKHTISNFKSWLAPLAHRTYNSGSGMGSPTIIRLGLWEDQVCQQGNFVTHHH